ncbi:MULTISPECIES: nucleotidyl cyclase domain-containing protein [Microbacterium]|uniref:GGDEF domain-containing protein n=1 Tax=Microbacterium testaceum TaxID=2033 RepID=A0A4Y3QG56_MICTE|nr:MULTISPECIES: hypothetical protein [Microbacterium]MDZ5145787.1 hypothetical protein [Microbacterium testaceum]PNW09825.1 hypothetical protein C1632_05350 [Microbacterium testaceum]REC99835.1 GGDEF domain-containing protein [Microbacterium sp. AG157]WJS91452.1 hypothetical protein NYQ11_02555 [Microbacterium testaceum]GEB44095.1 hypothetical protein MTE01_00400 [Microbacterium testaceum]
MPSDVLSNLGLAQATIATLGTVMIIGLGFLHRPSRSALLWSLAFVLAMTSTWVSVTGAMLNEESVRRAGLGLMLGAPALIWSGFRARRGVRALPWVSAIQALATALIFVLVTDTSAYGLVFRLAFVASSVFAGLTVWELRRAADRLERLALPLTVVCAIFVALGVGTLVSGLAAPTALGDLALPRVLNGLGMLVFLVCATVSLLYFTSVSPSGRRAASSWPHFVVTATDRLARARRAQEESWAVLTVRLDDPAQLRSAAGESGWLRLVGQFESLVADTFPAEADLGREIRGRVVVVVSRPDSVLRELVRTLLRQITELDVSAYIDIQLSASIGWVPAKAADYDLNALIVDADAAACEATRRGGDCWERVRA